MEKLTKYLQLLLLERDVAGELTLAEISARVEAEFGIGGGSTRR